MLVRIPWTFGMMTAIARVDAVTRAMSSPSCSGSTSATFHVYAGTVMWPPASDLVTPPLLPVPPTPAGPETM